MKCIVTGATGFIGRQLCQQLLSRGDTVVALSKNGADLDAGLSTRALDLATTDLDAAMLEDVDVVFHLAGIAHQNAPGFAYQQLNYEATLRLARRAASAGVGCFIFLSSVKAMGASTAPECRSENDCTPPIDDYGLSKWQAECALRKEFVDQPMSVVILRPALVYGTQAKGNLQRLAAAVRKGLPRPPEVGQRSMLALDDLVNLLCHIATNPPPGVHTWIACGNDAYSTRAIYDLLRRASGKGRGAGWLPQWAWRLAAGVLDVIAGSPTESTFDKLFGTELYSNAALVAATGWRPRMALVDVIGSASPDRPGA